MTAGTFKLKSEVFGDRYGEGGALSNLGDVLREVWRFDEAIGALIQAAAVFRKTGDQPREGTAMEGAARAHNERWLRAQ